MNPEELRTRIAGLPRARFAHLPTPLEELPRLSAALGGPRIFIKRDDCTGLAFGGNKTRQFEFALGDAVASGADAIVTGAASQSNHCRQAAAACARLGLPCHLVLTQDAHRHPVQGNLLLMGLLGAHIRFVDAELGPGLEPHKRAVVEELRAKGLKPYVLASDRGNASNAAAYVDMVLELEGQLRERHLRPTRLYICSAGPTGAGVRLGAKLLETSWKMVAVAPIVWPFDTPEHMAKIARSAAEHLGVSERVSPADFDVRTEYVGKGYGDYTRETREALELMARTEGIVLDPVYSAKALAGLAGDIRRGALTRDDTVVFVHTGGTPALFAYASEVSMK